MSLEGVEEKERKLKEILKEVEIEISKQIPSNYGGQCIPTETVEESHIISFSHCVEDRRRKIQQSKQKLDQAESLVMLEIFVS